MLIHSPHNNQVHFQRRTHLGMSIPAASHACQHRQGKVVISVSTYMTDADTYANLYTPEPFAQLRPIESVYWYTCTDVCTHQCTGGNVRHTQPSSSIATHLQHRDTLGHVNADVVHKHLHHIRARCCCAETSQAIRCQGGQLPSSTPSSIGETHDEVSLFGV